jgi:ComF family protein
MFPARHANVNERGRSMSTIADSALALRALAARGWRALTAVALPPVCCLCGAAGQASAFDLCDVCATFLPVVDDESGSTLVSGDGTLLRTLFVFKYAPPIDEFIRALKFRGERIYARVLGELMARAQRERGAAMPDSIVPMPLHALRYRERGFNQAEEIARYAAASLGVRVDSRALVRAVETREQSGLSLEGRKRNVRHAFEVVGAVPKGRIALLDDVVTTGSTAGAAIQALRDAGAGEVELWAVARVERMDQGRDG